MSRSFAPATVAAMQEGRLVDRGLVLLDLGSGLYGFWTGFGKFTYEGVDYIGSGKLIEFSGYRQTADLSSVEVTLKLSSVPDTELTPDVLMTIELETYHQRPCTLYTAYFDPDTYALLSVEVEYRGYIDRIVHVQQDDGEATMEIYVESRFRDHTKSGYRVRSDIDQKLLDPNDNGLRHVTKVSSEPVLFGRSKEPPPAPKKKKWWQFW